MEPAITAYVDSRYPSFAWAFQRDDTFVPFTWGLFELQLLVVMVVLAALLAAGVVRWHRAG
jgi:hypothetical protein